MHIFQINIGFDIMKIYTVIKCSCNPQSITAILQLFTWHCSMDVNNTVYVYVTLSSNFHQSHSHQLFKHAEFIYRHVSYSTKQSYDFHYIVISYRTYYW